MTDATHRTSFWVVYATASLVALLVAARLFPVAIPILNLDIRMSRDAAIATARGIASRLHLAPDEARAVARFAHDGTTQNYIELEGGGRPAFAALTRGQRYSPYWWEVRLFTPGAVDETLVRLKPDGTPAGFAHRIAETDVRAPERNALDSTVARTIAETKARDDWGVDLSRYRFLEAAQHTQTTGRIDHSFTYEQPGPVGDARIRLTLDVAGDELTGVVPFVHVPESFGRRFEALRSANVLIATLASLSAGVLYGVGGCIIALLWLARCNWLVWRPAVGAGLVVGALLAAGSLAASGDAWFAAGTTETVATFWTRQGVTALLIAVAGGLAYALVFMTAESLTRRAFPDHPQLWRLWSREAASTPQVAGRTLGGYLFVPIELALVAAFYYATNRWLGWWQPSEVMTDPNILGSAIPALTPIAVSLQAGFMEECVFRAIPLSLGALIGARYGRRGAGIAIAVVVQALVFGGAHATYPGFPAYSRPVELFVPSILWALIYLRFGLLPTILLHATFDLVLFSIPLFLVDAPGAWVQQALVIAAASVPLAIVALRRWQAGRWHALPSSLRNGAWRPAAPAVVAEVASALAAGRFSAAFQRGVPALGVLGFAAWAFFAPFTTDVAPMTLDRAGAIGAADAALAAEGVALGPEWHRFAVVRLATDDASQWTWHKFVWREAGPDAYRRLVGTMLAPPVWEVRYVRLDGDVVERAEEWRLAITDDGRVRAMTHALPESRAGARLSRAAARTLAEHALTLRFGIDAATLRLVAADEQQLPSRTDWSFTFGDPGTVVGDGGEARYVVAVGGDAVTGAGRYVHVPETWTRAEATRANRLQVVGIAAVVIFFAAGVAALVVGILGFVRHRVDGRLLRIVFGAMLAVAVLAAANHWPVAAMQLSTTAPLASQLTTKVLGALAAALMGALLAALCAGVGAWGAQAAPPFVRIARWPAALLPIAAGVFVVGLQAALGALAPADAPRWPQAAWQSQASPIAGGALSGFAFLGFAGVQLFVVYLVARLTQGFSRRLWLAVAVVVVLECAASLVDGRADPAGALVSGLVAGGAAASVLLLLIRHDPRLVPAFAATIALMNGAVAASQAGAWWPFTADAVATIAVAIALTRHLRRTGVPGAG